MIKFILMDIEGTTTRISFVKDVLFPYAYARMEDFLLENKELHEVQKIVSACDFSYQEAATKMRELIKNDVKDPELKTLQGLIWREGYKSGELVAHLYDDVVPAWENWLESGVKLGIYSSGSVAAQKLLFGHTAQGDLNPMLSAYYDLSTGTKSDTVSYGKILSDLGLSGSEVLFLSDMSSELDAAREHGIRTSQLFREIPISFCGHDAIQSFEEVTL